MKHYWLVIVVILSVVSVSGSCTEVPGSTSMPAPATPEASTPTPDTTPLPPITGLIIINAYDRRVNLWWEKSTAEDFDHYNIYTSELEIKDVAGQPSRSYGTKPVPVRLDSNTVPVFPLRVFFFGIHDCFRI